MRTINAFTQFVVLVSLPLLLGGCEEKVEVAVKPVEEKQQKVKPTEEAPVNPNLKYEIKGDTVTITGCKNYNALGALIIPAAIEGKPVTSIGYAAFSGCTSLTSITIPDSVISIGDHAFWGCSNLTSITIPDGVTSIEGYAFKDCTSLTSITIPDSVTSIGNYAFSNCIKLTGITIGDSVTSIEVSAFSDCTSLTNIAIPDGVTSIWWSAFARCTSLMSVTIGDSVTSIGDFAFAFCKSLTAVTFLGDAPKVKAYYDVFIGTTSTIYRKPEAKGWGDIWGGRSVKLISEKP